MNEGCLELGLVYLPNGAVVHLSNGAVAHLSNGAVVHLSNVIQCTC